MTFLQIGARYEGYASTIGRPVVFGKATAAQKSLIEAGYAVQEEMLAITRAGVPARDIAKRHLEKVRELGYEDHYLYGPYHGNGLMEGEAPWVETDSNYVLQENMTFCSDIFLGSHKTKIGLRIEDVVRVTADGCENLTNYPRKLFEIL
jgi:Xaa-Pro aminopeptidase